MYKLFPLRMYEDLEKTYDIVDAMLSENIFDGFEVSPDYDYDKVVQSNYHELIDYAIKKYEPIVTCHSNPNFNLSFNDERLRQFAIDGLKKEIDFASSIGARLVVIHPGCYGQMDVPQTADTPQKQFLIELEQTKINRAIDNTIKGLQELCDHAMDKNVKIALENIILKNEVGKSPEDMNHIFESVNRSNLIFTLDAGHSFRYGIDPTEYIERLDFEPSHLHLSDNDGTCDLHDLIGVGDIDFQKLFNHLNEINYEGTVLCEVFLDSIEGLRNEASKITKLQEGKL